MGAKPSKPSSASHMPQAKLKCVKKNAAPPPSTPTSASHMSQAELTRVEENVALLFPSTPSSASHTSQTELTGVENPTLLLLSKRSSASHMPKAKLKGVKKNAKPPPSTPSSASHMPKAKLKGVEKNDAPPYAMFRVENSDTIEENMWGPGALVRVRNEAAEAADERDVYLLVTHSKLLPSIAISSLCHVNLHAPSGAALRGIPRQWVQYVLVDSGRHTTLVQLTQLGVNAMLATGVACSAVATVVEGMCATHVWGTSALAGRPVIINRVKGKTIILERKIENYNENGLLVGEDGSLLAVVDYFDKIISLAGIVSDFLESRKWQIRCRSLVLARTMISIRFI